MSKKRVGTNFGIRYSEAFKMEVVRELEENDLPFGQMQRKYGIKGCGTVQSWARKYGNGSRGKVIRVEKPEEINELRSGSNCVSGVLEIGLGRRQTLELAIEQCVFATWPASVLASGMWRSLKKRPVALPRIEAVGLERPAFRQ